jgi:hypothetical protein
MTRERYAFDIICRTTLGDIWLGFQECASLEDARIQVDFAKTLSKSFLVFVIAKHVDGEWETVETFNRYKRGLN